MASSGGYTASIIVCTRNRADDLRKTLESIGRCDVPADLPTELLVVDNGSTDHTQDVVDGAGLKNMPVRCVREPRAGLGRARNRALAEAHGEVFLFTDDDVRVPRNWIQGMCRPLAEGNADAIAGGVIFPPEHERLLAVEPFHSRRGWFASTHEIDRLTPTRMVGANMAFGRHVLEEILEFDVRLGAGALGFYEETLFAWRLLDAGYRIAGRLDIAVEHHFDLSRVRRRSLLSMARRIGASEAYVDWHWHHVAPTRSPQLRRDRNLGLPVRRELWCFLSSSVEGWEYCRVRKVAYCEQLRRESSEPRRYIRLNRPALAAAKDGQECKALV